MRADLLFWVTGVLLAMFTAIPFSNNGQAHASISHVGIECDGVSINALPNNFPTTPTTYVISTNIVIESSIEVPDQIILCIEETGRLALAPNSILTILGGFKATAQEVFTGWESLGYKECNIEPTQNVVLPLDVTLLPEWFGARGDGISNDTKAFARAGRAISSRGGGRLELQPDTTYIVGEQTFQGCDRSIHYAYTADPILYISKSRYPVHIDGRGATLRGAEGLHFGAQDFETGQPVNHGKENDYFVTEHISNAYRGMIDAEDNADILIENLELDGNSSSMIVGGVWGDSGRQTVATGIRAYNNGKLTVRNVYTHHHGLDGIIAGYKGLKSSDRATPILIEDVVSEHNWRQGLSLVGGIEITVRRSAFNNNSTGLYRSSPGAGIDIEAEGSVIRDVVIEDTLMENNRTWGLVAASGDSAGIKVKRSRMWGPIALAVKKPFVSVEDSELFGGVNKVWGEPICDPLSAKEPSCDKNNPEHPDNRSDATKRTWGDDSEATSFKGCLFEDRDSPWMLDNIPWSNRSGSYLLNITGGHNVLFNNSFIRTRHVRAMFLGAINQTQVLREIRIEHGTENLPRKNPGRSFQSLMSGVYLNRVCFSETSNLGDPSGDWYVHASTNASVIGNDIHISGPSIRWNSWVGSLGLAQKLIGESNDIKQFDNNPSSCPVKTEIPSNLNINPGPGENYTFGFRSTIAKSNKLPEKCYRNLKKSDDKRQVFRVDREITLAADYEFNEDIDICVLEGGLFNLAENVNLTIKGSLFASAYPVFKYKGAPNRIKIGRTTNIYPEWWGAIADDNQDDTDAFRKMELFVADQHGGTIRLSKGTYTISQQDIKSKDHESNGSR